MRVNLAGTVSYAAGTGRLRSVVSTGTIHIDRGCGGTHEGGVWIAQCRIRFRCAPEEPG